MRNPRSRAHSHSRGPAHNASAMEPIPADAFHHHAPETDAIPDARGAHRGAGADVGSKKRREDQQRWQPPSGDEEIGRTAHAPADPQADAQLQHDKGGKQPDCDVSSALS